MTRETDRSEAVAALDWVAAEFPVDDVSPGPWVVERGSIAWMVREGQRGPQIGNFILEADARFVAACRNQLAASDRPTAEAMYEYPIGSGNWRPVPDRPTAEGLDVEPG